MVWVKDLFVGPWMVNVCFTLPHAPTWHDGFSLFLKFSYHDSFDSKGLNHNQNEDVGGAMP